MNEVTITVRGEHEERIPAEQGVVRLSLRAEASERGAAVEDLAAIANPVRADLAAREAAGSLLRWTSSRATVWTERTWSAEGTRSSPVHHASVELSVTFTDPATLSAWVDEVAVHDGAQIDGVTWRLSDDTAASARARVAAAAVRDAVSRARAYADAIGLASVVPAAIADTGLLAGDQPPAPRMMRAMAAESSGPAVELRPEDVVVTATVEARFLAR